ncbi:hypothetical protein [Xanthomonas axonopodis]|uniref:hypothetical protein n=1 Tax=Xanthomonas axonopodis TaxID=53413 RepID=UPI003555F00B
MRTLVYTLRQRNSAWAPIPTYQHRHQRAPWQRMVANFAHAPLHSQKKKSNKRITVMMGTHSNGSHLHAKEKTVAPMAGATKIIHKHGHTLRFNLKLFILYDLS